MEKLTFYALSAPEKLDRIGAYLSERLSRDVARHRYGYVCIAMEALDQLLMACHCQSINLFVESFLTMVRKLLEADKPNLQILGTNSFVKFANIEEDTASYHRSYDFFVSRFSEMCHSSYEDPDVRTKIRMAGIRGLQGVVRKTVRDELQANIWERQHMDKIVPSLLFNLQDPTDSPAELTERCFRELLGRAAYGNIKNAIKPVLMHLDNHSLWEGKSFAVRCFKIIMYSIQSQHSHLVIQQLLGHLDANSKSSATVRAGIVEVLSEAAVIEASGSVGDITQLTYTTNNCVRGSDCVCVRVFVSVCVCVCVCVCVGPTVLEVFNTLLKQLRLSVDYELTGSCDPYCNNTTTTDQERQLQEAVIKTIGSFANTLPIYQRAEVMLFIMGKIPVPGIYPALGSPIAGRVESSNMLAALPSSFLEPLLSFTLMEDPEIRLLVLSILISLIDRHQNTHKFTFLRSVILSDISVLKLKMDKCSRQDNLFMKKHGQRLYRHIFLTCSEENSGRSHYQALYTLLALLSVELANEEVVVDLIRLALALQDLALANDERLSLYNRCAVHALSAAYLSLISQLTTVPAFCQHIQEVIELRQKEVPYLLPEDIFIENPRVPESLERVEGEVLFQQFQIAEVLGGSGYNIEILNTPFTPQITDEDRLSKRKSIGDTISLQMDMDPRYSPEREQVDLDSVNGEEQEREKRRLVVERFQTAPFEEIAAHCGAKSSLLQSKLDQIFELTIRPPPSPSGSASQGQTPTRSVPVYEMKFPDLCVY
uniref:EFR3 homolog Ba (S. cerevisiae) n=1 Tax=Oncorhynchus mykiss TaxID=8022 RepID=A0A8K9X610_ONCMY